MSGFVKIWRASPDHHLFEGDSARFGAWVWLITNAAWKETAIRIKGETIILQRGELSFSVRFLAEKWGWSKSRVDRFIADLRQESMILTRSKIGTSAGHKAGQGQSIITICNYAQYQDIQSDAWDSSNAKSGTTAGQQRDKEEEGKKVKKKDIAVSDDTACDLDKPKSLAQFDTETIVDDDDTLNVDDVVEAWNDLARTIDRPVIKKLTDARRSIIKARLREHTIDDFAAVFAKVRRSKFLKGETGWHGFGFDWLMKQNNFIKALEGNYDDR